MLLGTEPKHVSADKSTAITAASRPTLENVLVLLMDVLEDLRRETEVLCYNSLGCVLDPLVQEESRIFGEVATVKHQQELGSILAQALEGVWVTRWEVPQVSLLQVVDEGTAVSVQRRNANLALSMLAAILRALLTLLAHLTGHKPIRPLYANGARG